LDPVAVEPAAGDLGEAVEVRYIVALGRLVGIKELGVMSLRSEESGQEVSHNTAHAVLAEDIQRIVNLDVELQLGGIIAGHGSNDAEDNSRPRWYEAGRRGDSDEARDGTGAETDRGPFLVEAVIKQHPSNTTHRSSDVSNNTSHDRAHVGRERRAAIEAEPSDPEEDRAKDDMSNIVRSVWEAMGVAIAGPLAQHEGVCKGCCARGDMDWSSACEVKSAHLVGPSCGVPSPAGNGVVDYRCPDEDEDAAGEHAASVCCSADCEGGTNVVSNYVIWKGG
jgi:hypothetical protein